VAHRSARGEKLALRALTSNSNVILRPQKVWEKLEMHVPLGLQVEAAFFRRIDCSSCILSGNVGWMGLSARAFPQFQIGQKALYYAGKQACSLDRQRCVVSGKCACTRGPSLGSAG
jgi:hypothetical protein